MEPITLKDLVSIITPVMMLIIGIGVGVIGYFLKSSLEEVKKKFEQIDKKIPAVEKSSNEAIGRVERDYLEFKALMPRQFVLKDDYIRTISVFEKKLDDMNINIVKLVKREHGPESHL